MPVHPDVFDCDDLALHIPEDNDEALQLHVTPTELDPNRDAVCDRFLAYHGVSQGGVEARARATRWARLNILGARFAGFVHDELRAANGLAAEEASLCKWLNTQAGAPIRVLRAAAVDRAGDLHAGDVTVVGIDQYGVDVRVRFGIQRAEFPLVAANVNIAKRMLEEWIRSDDPRSGA